MTQTLLDFTEKNPPRARNTDPETSHLAAERAQHFRGRQAMQVLEALRLHDGSTSAELAEKSGLDYHAIGRRMKDLLNAGLVREGKKVNCTVRHSPCLCYWVNE